MDIDDASIDEYQAEAHVDRELFSRVVDLLQKLHADCDSDETLSSLASAMEELEQFQSVHPDSVPALRLLAECAQRLDDLSRARKYIDQAELLDPWNLEILIISESIYEAEADSSKCRPGQPLRVHNDLDSGVVNIEKLIEKAMGSFRLGDFERAYTLAKLAYRIYPENEHHLMDILAIGSGFDPERTRRELIILEDEDPPPAFLYLALGSVSNVLGLHDQATAWLARGISLNPKDPYLQAMLYNEMAYVMARQEIRFDQCIALARQALAVFPERQANGFIRDTLGVAYLKSGDTEKAIRNLREAVSKDPTVIPRFHLALALLNDKDPANALGELKQIAASSASLESPHVEETAILARVQSHIGRLEDLLNLGSANDIRDALEILDGLM
jgi:tetratricopeptide (TPR) repeat protein